MNIRLVPLASTEDCAVTAPIPVRTRGVPWARSKLVMQVAEPRTISPVRVSVMRMDQVADAGAVRARVAERAASLQARGSLWVSVGMLILN